MTERGAQSLPMDRLAAALASITAWRLNPEKSVPCPVCGASVLQIVDQSSRPYAEWYALRCPSCGLDHTLNIPLLPPM
jgi:predicted RNA-binding Zn-ribbon protein involved in translation (DUF1610 family)